MEGSADDISTAHGTSDSCNNQASHQVSDLDGAFAAIDAAADAWQDLQAVTVGAGSVQAGAAAARGQQAMVNAAMKGCAPAPVDQGGERARQQAAAGAASTGLQPAATAAAPAAPAAATTC
jgi:hypothetical protein